MKNIYYQIWVDCIASFKKNNTDWKWKSMLYINLAMGFNLMFVLYFLGNFFPIFKKYHIEIDIFRGTSLDALVEYVILYGVPIYLLNYFLIFYNRKFEKLLTSYPNYSGKYFLVYFIMSLGLPFIGITIYFFNQ